MVVGAAAFKLFNLFPLLCSLHLRSCYQNMHRPWKDTHGSHLTPTVKVNAPQYILEQNIKYMLSAQRLCCSVCVFSHSLCTRFTPTVQRHRFGLIWECKLLVCTYMCVCVCVDQQPVQFVARLSPSWANEWNGKRLWWLWIMGVIFKLCIVNSFCFLYQWPSCLTMFSCSCSQ